MKKKKRIDSDHLGAMGHKLFAAMCETAELVCNSSDRDRVGWDCLVTFPFSSNRTTSTLDKREAPISCHVQVKTIYDWNTEVKLRLSSAEWIAKEVKPSFIYILRVNEDLKSTDGYLIHLMDAPLATILRRLRLEQAKGDLEHNKKVISMSVRKGKKLSPEGKALRAALEEACGLDLQDYMKRKKQQLGSVGFEGRPITLKVKLHFEDADEEVDAFLGLKKNIRATDVRVSETRFGIELPLSEHDESQISIQPNSTDTCSITFRGQDLSVPAVFKGALYVPSIPNLPPKRRKVRIDAELFEFIATKEEFMISTAAGTAPRLLSEWVNFWKVCSVLGRGVGNIEVRASNGARLVSVDVKRDEDEGLLAESRRFLAASEAAVTICKMAGVFDEPKITAARLERLAAHLIAAHGIAGNSSEDMSLTIDRLVSENPTDGEEIEVLFISYIPFGAVAVGYYATLWLRIEVMPDNIRGTCNKKWKMHQIRVLSNFPNSYEQFVEAARKDVTCQNWFATPLPED